MIKINSIQREEVPKTHVSYLLEMNADQQKAVIQKAQQVEKVIFRDDMPAVIKAFAVFQHMAVSSIYDVVNYYQKPHQNSSYRLPDEDYLLIGAMCKGVAVCASVARCVCMLLERQEIECRVIVGELNGGGHAWNIVKIEGEWYQMDATAAENYFAAHRINPGFDINRVWWKWFLKTDEEMRETGRTWEVDKYPVCRTGKYSNDGARKAVEAYNASGQRRILTNFISIKKY